MKFDRKGRKRANKLHRANWASSKAVFLDKEPDQRRYSVTLGGMSYAGEKCQNKMPKTREALFFRIHLKFKIILPWITHSIVDFSIFIWTWPFLSSYTGGAFSAPCV